MSLAIANQIAIGQGNGSSATPITVSPLTVKGGVVRVIDSATGDIARTTAGWIEDEKYVWFYNDTASAVSVEFDSAVTRTGRLTLKLSSTNTSGFGAVGIPANIGANLPVADSKYLSPAKPSTTYRLVFYYKTLNRTGAGNPIAQLLQYNSALARVTFTNGSTVNGTNDWTKETITVTTSATTTGLAIRFMMNAGAIEDNWFDVNSMTLEEVSSITNSGSFPALLYPKVTAVTSTDNIDQSQVTSSGALIFGDAGTRQASANAFTPKKKNQTGIVIRRRASTGTFTGNVTVSIQATTSSLPNGTVIATTTIPNATWEAITAATDYTVAFNYTVTPGTTYSIVLESSTHNNSNHPNIEGNSTTSGYLKYNGTTWSTDGTAALYFKTLYSKNTTNFTVSTATETASVTAPTTDGWANGTVIDFADYNKSVTLATGTNAIYVSSNGASIADETVDPSLEGIFSGTYWN